MISLLNFYIVKLLQPRLMGRILFVVFLLFTLYLLPNAPSPALAADIGITKQPEFGVKVGTKSGATLVGQIVNTSIILFFTAGAVGVLIMLLWGAVEWIFSGGDKEKVASARKRITTAIIGVFLLSLVFVIVGVIGQITGFNMFSNLKIPSWNKP